MASTPVIVGCLVVSYFIVGYLKMKEGVPLALEHVRVSLEKEGHDTSDKNFRKAFNLWVILFWPKAISMESHLKKKLNNEE